VSSHRRPAKSWTAAGPTSFSFTPWGRFGPRAVRGYAKPFLRRAQPTWFPLVGQVCRRKARPHHRHRPGTAPTSSTIGRPRLPPSANCGECALQAIAEQGFARRRRSLAIAPWWGDKAAATPDKSSEQRCTRRPKHRCSRGFDAVFPWILLAIPRSGHSDLMAPTPQADPPTDKGYLSIAEVGRLPAKTRARTLGPFSSGPTMRTTVFGLRPRVRDAAHCLCPEAGRGQRAQGLRPCLECISNVPPPPRKALFCSSPRRPTAGFAHALATGARPTDCMDRELCDRVRADPVHYVRPSVSRVFRRFPVKFQSRLSLPPLTAT